MFNKENLSPLLSIACDKSDALGLGLTPKECQVLLCLYAGNGGERSLAAIGRMLSKSRQVVHRQLISAIDKLAKRGYAVQAFLKMLELLHPAVPMGLTETECQVLALCYANTEPHECSHTAIASRTGISVNMVQIHLESAHSKLRDGGFTPADYLAACAQ
jgi:DNA-binding CsgD family transcriptional regulator